MRNDFGIWVIDIITIAVTLRCWTWNRLGIIGYFEIIVLVLWRLTAAMASDVLGSSNELDATCWIYESKRAYDLSNFGSAPSKSFKMSKMSWHRFVTSLCEAQYWRHPIKKNRRQRPSRQLTLVPICLPYFLSQNHYCNIISCSNQMVVWL